MVVGDFTVSYPCRQENGEKLECEVAISLYILKDTDGREDYRRSVISCTSSNPWGQLICFFFTHALLRLEILLANLTDAGPPGQRFPELKKR